MKKKIKVINSTTRPGRKGPKIAVWISEYVQKNFDFDVEFIDLGELNLPLMNEPHHPRLQQYQHEYTKQWSRKIDEADAFIFVTAEYNHSFPAPLKNAIDYLSQEWNYKPVGFVSYGGVSGGTRATNALKQVVSTLKMVPLFEAVHIPFYTNFISERTGKFEPNEITTGAAETMLQELETWANALKNIREKKMAAV